ncbi:MAG TPA: IS110 family transposase [Bacteroidales bacterium]|nr:IS110 family transposase [Bacteroidales bacterium]
MSRIVRLRISQHDKELYKLLNSISGIGPLTSSALITEIGDINRFPQIDHLASYVGLIPKIRESGETIRTGGITLIHSLEPYLLRLPGKSSGRILLLCNTTRSIWLIIKDIKLSSK